MRGADRVAEAGGSPSAQLAMLGDELLDVIHRYPDHVWVFLHEFPALTGERAAHVPRAAPGVRAAGRGRPAGRRRVGRVPRPRPVAHGPGVARHAQLHLPVAEGRAAACRPATWRSRSPRSSSAASARPDRSGRRVAAVDHHRRAGGPPGPVAGEVRVRAHEVVGRPSPSGCRPAIASSASGGRSSWIAERNVPGHTQFTRIPSRAYSTAATFASWITAAFVAQYGAACDQAVSPETDAVSTIEPDRCGPHDRHRGPDAVDGTEDVDPERALPVLGRQVVDAPVRREHAGVADQHVEAAEALDRQRRPPTATWSTSLTSARAVSTAPVASPRPATVASSEGSLTSLSTRSVAGSPASRRDIAAPSAPPAPVIATTRRGCGWLRSYEQVPAVDVEHGAGDERRGVGGQELVGAGQVGGGAPAPLGGVPGDRRRRARGCSSTPRPAASRTTPERRRSP